MAVQFPPVGATVWTQVSYKSATLARWKSPSIRILILKGHLA
ncbi:hypothetical protein HDF22_001054, partial [Mucilaginibacter lappiensis]|nr:hypothetical protein [Mucilaginibacter lappiensis]